MRIEELSIENWVKVNYGLGKNQIFKVVSITEENFVYLYNKEMDKGYALGHLISELDPVYIQDVIDKLGFEKKVDGRFEYYEIIDDYYDIRMAEYSDGMYEISAVNCEFNMPIKTILTSCVHTLQNFLTMVNADKKIEL